MQERVGDINRKIKTLRNNQKKILETKYFMEIKNAFDRLISKLYTTAKRISELEDTLLIESSQTNVNRK